MHTYILLSDMYTVHMYILMKYFSCICFSVCVCACGNVCVWECVCVGVWECVRVGVCACGSVSVWECVHVCECFYSLNSKYIITLCSDVNKSKDTHPNNSAIS